jgi:glutathione S-transferase
MSTPDPQLTFKFIRLYDLVLENGCTISPFVWRIKYAIAHKGFAIESVPVGFTGIKKILDGNYERLPIIDDGGTIVPDSWAIADYLDATYPDRAPLFATKAERVAARFFDAWLWREIFPPMFRCYVLDNYNFVKPEDRAYIRESRERIFLGGKSLEETVAGREERMPAIRRSLQPLRNVLKETPWLGGERPNYSDYCGLSAFLWAASINTCPPLEADDPLFDWINRGFDLYDAVCKDPRLRPLAA